MQFTSATLLHFEVQPSNIAYSRLQLVRNHCSKSANRLVAKVVHVATFLQAYSSFGTENILRVVELYIKVEYDRCQK